MLIHTAQRIIESDRSLKILDHATYGREQLGFHLPTWVPDWTSKKIDYGLDRCESLYDNCRGSGEGNEGFKEAKFREDPTNKANVDIKVQGIRIGSLKASQGRAGTVQDFPDLQMFSVADNLSIVTIDSALPDDEVWLLLGSANVQVLRVESKDTYSYIGRALISNNSSIRTEESARTNFEQSLKKYMKRKRDIWLL